MIDTTSWLCNLHEDYLGNCSAELRVSILDEPEASDICISIIEKLIKHIKLV